MQVLPEQYGGAAALQPIQDAVAARRAAEADRAVSDSADGDSSDGGSDSVSELGDGRLTAARRALG